MSVTQFHPNVILALAQSVTYTLVYICGDTVCHFQPNLTLAVTLSVTYTLV
jgi:hypothetical protein